MLKLKAGATDEDRSKFIKSLKSIKPLRKYEIFKRSQLYINDVN